MAPSRLILPALFVGFYFSGVYLRGAIRVILSRRYPSAIRFAIRPRIQQRQLLRGFRFVLIVGADDALHQMMAHHVGSSK